MSKLSSSDKEALFYHAKGTPGKISISASKPLITQRDLALAYSPGVAAPCLEIFEDSEKAYDYTAKGNLVAVVTNGSSVLGLGNIGALASKPVMEGKAVLFKRFADINAIDIEVNAKTVEEFVACVEKLEPTFGGINLEDIKAPECFLIEEALKKSMNIPVFHDDQHGTAISVVAALINAVDITGKHIKNLKIVCNGAGAAAIACVRLLREFGISSEQIIVCDRSGVIYKGRTTSMNPWKEEVATPTALRTLEDAFKGADVFIGLSIADSVSQSMVQSMAASPIIFAMANPVPEISPEKVREVAPHAIIATGRSDYPNQINNVLGFPYIFRGALDVRAHQINDAMKLAAAHALAKLAREDVPEEVSRAYASQTLLYGSNYILPTPFDPRLITAIPPAVAFAAQETGVAHKKVESQSTYIRTLRSRIDPTYSNLQLIFEEVRNKHKTIIFAEGEEDKTIRAAVSFCNSGYGKVIIIGREKYVQQAIHRTGLTLPDGCYIHNAKLSSKNEEYTDFLYRRLQRKGYLYRDCQRLVHQDRNIFGACMLAFGEADAMVTGLTRNYSGVLQDLLRVLDVNQNGQVMGLTVIVEGGKTVFIADTAVADNPNPLQLAKIAVQSAQQALDLGHTPRVALLSHSNFGNPMGKYIEPLLEALKILEAQNVDFEFDGDMTVETALSFAPKEAYPFCRLSQAANVLIMPNLHTASIASQLLSGLGTSTTIGPLLVGLQKPVQIASMHSSVSDLITLGVLSLHQAITQEKI